MRRARVLFGVSIVLLLAIEGALTTSTFENASSSLDLIFDNAIPSVTELTEMGDACADLSTDLDLADSARDASVRRSALSRAGAALSRVRGHARAYERFPAFPDEPRLQEHLDSQIDDLEAAIRSASSEEGADAPVRKRVQPALSACRASVRALTRFNAQQAASWARRISLAHVRAERLALLLSLTLIVVGVGTWLAIERLTLRREEEASRRIAELDAFAARVAHDLKGPLTAVVMATGLLEQDEGLSERSRRAVDRSRASVERMTALIDGLLEFARAGAAPDGGAETSIDAVTENIRATIQPLADAGAARLAIEVEPGLRARASAGVVASILQNLLRNAIEHLGESQRREVKLRIRSDARFLRIEVEDTGPGIPEDVQARLFRPFQRGPTAAAGHGLGLATVKRLVEGHGGSVELRSRVGEGTTFAVKLPRV